VEPDELFRLNLNGMVSGEGELNKDIDDSQAYMRSRGSKLTNQRVLVRRLNKFAFARLAVIMMMILDPGRSGGNRCHCGGDAKILCLPVAAMRVTRLVEGHFVGPDTYGLCMAGGIV
jgi:hypothetical protein